MSRSVEEWIGKGDDSIPPPRVKLRIFNKYDGVCQCGCTRKIHVGEPWQCDHIIALINGGANKESNMHPLLTEHHKNKTKEDVAEKSVIYSIRKKYLGIKKKSRFPGSRDSPFKRKVNGTVVRREK